jgi:hypothetical protein
MCARSWKHSRSNWRAPRNSSKLARRRPGLRMSRPAKPVFPVGQTEEWLRPRAPANPSNTPDHNVQWQSAGGLILERESRNGSLLGQAAL